MGYTPNDIRRYRPAVRYRTMNVLRPAWETRTPKFLGLTSQ